MRRIASTRFTLMLFALLAGGVVYSYLGTQRSPWPVALPLGLLALNLGAALGVNRAFRAQLPLLAFHLALVAVVVLIALGQLTALNGRVELSTGETFEGTLLDQQAGPWHRSTLREIPFTNEGFEIAYGPGLVRRDTRNRVSWVEEGRRRVAEIGDQHPLVLGGYRFYTTPNKGFAPILRWRSARGNRHQGTVHLPPYPLNDFRQATEWMPPESDSRLWLMLSIDEKPIDAGRESAFRLPRDHALVVRHGEERVVLRPGERWTVSGGELAYEGLTTWMGYTVFYDWTLPWLLAACLTAVGALAWHYWRRFTLMPWDAPP